MEKPNSSNNDRLGTPKERKQTPLTGWETTKSVKKTEYSRQSRFYRKQKEIPKRPTSPHLALGHRDAPQEPQFSEDVSPQVKKEAMRAFKKDRREYIKSRADQLEKLVTTISLSSLYDSTFISVSSSSNFVRRLFLVQVMGEVAVTIFSFFFFS